MSIVSPALTKCNPWIDIEAFCCKIDKADADQAQQVIEAASDYLWRCTGCRYAGECETTLRPYVCGCGGYWGYCGCLKLELTAPGNLPIIEITEVRVNGTIMDPDTYVLLGSKWFVPRGNSNLYFPYQDMNVDPGDQGSWEIDITYGEEVPALGKMACTDLAMELLKSCKGEECALPHGVSSLTQDGVTYNFESIATGYTNIQTVDFFLSEHGGYVLQKWSGFGIPGSPTMIVET